MLASIIRTVVPLLVQLVVTQLALRFGIDAGPFEELIANAIGALVAAIYYAVVRFLESKRKWFGWLLGLAKPPSYDATARADQASPTGQVAADASPIPEGTPVEVTPADPEGDPAAYGGV